jgi:WD40 repeat protein
MRCESNPSLRRRATAQCYSVCKEATGSMQRRQVLKLALASTLSLAGIPAYGQSISGIEPAQVVGVGRGGVAGKPTVITAVAIAAGGQVFASAGDDHVVRLWSSKGQLLFSLKGHVDWVRTLTFSPDSQTLVSGGDDGQVIQWQVSSGTKLRELPVQDKSIYAVSYNAEGSQFATVGFSNRAYIYSADGEPVRSLAGPCADLRAVCFSPDGKRVAAAGRNGQIRIWNVGSGTMSLEIPGDIDRIRTLAFTADGKQLLSAGEGRWIAIWDAGDGNQVAKFACRGAKVQSLVFLGSDLFVTGGSDNVIRLWNRSQEAEQLKLVGHTGSVAALAFDAESGTLVSGSFDTTVRVWQLRSEDDGRDTARTPGRATR